MVVEQHYYARQGQSKPFGRSCMSGCPARQQSDSPRHALRTSTTDFRRENQRCCAKDWTHRDGRYRPPWRIPRSRTVSSFRREHVPQLHPPTVANQSCRRRDHRWAAAVHPTALSLIQAPAVGGGGSKPLSYCFRSAADQWWVIWTHQRGHRAGAGRIGSRSTGRRRCTAAVIATVAARAAVGPASLRIFQERLMASTPHGGKTQERKHSPDSPKSPARRRWQRRAPDPLFCCQQPLPILRVLLELWL